MLCRLISRVKALSKPSSSYILSLSVCFIDFPKQATCAMCTNFTDSYHKKIMKAEGHLYGSQRSQPVVRCNDEMFRMAEEGGDETHS